MDYLPLFPSLPESRESRWDALARFCEAWRVPWRIGGNDVAKELSRCEQRLGIPLPAALREWYLINGEGIRDWSDGLWLPPDQLRVDEQNRMLLFRVDDYDPSDPDWVSGIRIEDLSKPDPPVWHIDLLMKRSNPDSDAFSVHAIRQAFSKASSMSELFVVEDLDDLPPAALFALNAVLEDQFTPAELGAGQCSLWNKSVIHEGAEMFATVCRSSVGKYLEEGYLYLSFRTAAAAESVPAHLGRNLGIWSAKPGKKKFLAGSRTKVKPELISRDAQRMANRTAEALRSDGFTADFSLRNLTEIDRYFDEYSEGGAFTENCPLSKLPIPRIPALGAYLGETIVRSVGGRWEEIRTNEPPHTEHASSPSDFSLQLTFANNAKCWPLARVRKRLLNGKIDGVAAYAAGVEDLVQE